MVSTTVRFHTVKIPPTYVRTYVPLSTIHVGTGIAQLATDSVCSNLVKVASTDVTNRDGTPPLIKEELHQTNGGISETQLPGTQAHCLVNDSHGFLSYINGTSRNKVYATIMMSLGVKVIRIGLRYASLS